MRCYIFPNHNESLLSLHICLQLNNTLSLGQHRVWKRMAVKWSGAKAGSTALDVCCGSGDLAFVLSEAVGASGKVIPVTYPDLAYRGYALQLFPAALWKACRRDTELH